MIMPMFWSCGLRPLPSGGVKGRRSNGLEPNSITSTKKHHHRTGDRGHVRHQRAVARRGEPLGHRREAGQHHRPEQQRALLARPERRDDVIVRQVPGGIAGHVLDIEVVGDEPVPEAQRGHHQHPEQGVHRPGDRERQRRPGVPAAREPDHRRPAADQEGGPEGELSQQRHGLLPPLAARAAARKSSSERGCSAYSGRLAATSAS